MLRDFTLLNSCLLLLELNPSRLVSGGLRSSRPLLRCMLTSRMASPRLLSTRTGPCREAEAFGAGSAACAARAAAEGTASRRTADPLFACRDALRDKNACREPAFH